MIAFDIIKKLEDLYAQQSATLDGEDFGSLWRAAGILAEVSRYIPVLLKCGEALNIIVSNNPSENILHKEEGVAALEALEEFAESHSLFRESE